MNIILCGSSIGFCICVGCDELENVIEGND